MIHVNAVVFDLDGTLIKSKIDYEEMRRRVTNVLIDPALVTIRSASAKECLVGSLRLDNKQFRNIHKVVAACILAERDETEYGTLVVGRQGLSRSEEFLFGSISSKIVSHARNCTVWVVE